MQLSQMHKSLKEPAEMVSEYSRFVYIENAEYLQKSKMFCIV